MQYKFLLYGDGLSVPRIENLQWTFINSGKTPYFSRARKSSSGIISRSQWGANESYRYVSDDTYKAPELVDLSEDFHEKFADELKIIRTVESDKNGKEYRWPLQYPEKVRKIIVHHTATNGNLDNPKQAIRDIYHFHAVSKGWGDIGYNYIIDQDGKVYEGRAGGEGVIAAHAGAGNTGSIGIALLGNYETQVPSQKVLSSLGKLISEKSKIHKIDPEGESMFRGNMMPNIMGHKDINSTSCPGHHVYPKLPVIRSLADKDYNKKPRFKKDYDYQDLSHLHFVELEPWEEKELTIKMENIGKVTWNKDTILLVNQNSDFHGVISFPGKKGYTLAKMQEKEVKPGKKATFKFKIKALDKGDTVQMDIAPFINGKKKISDYIEIPVSVQQEQFKYEFLDAKYPPETMNKGEKFEARVRLKNTGNTSWKQGSVVLGTDHPRDRESAFNKDTPTRIAKLKEEEVKPGKTGTFYFNLTAPEKGGFYKEYFTPLVEGKTWMQDQGLHFDTLVYAGDYSAEFISLSPSATWEQGSKNYINLKIRNIGRKTWTKKNFKLGFIKEADLKVSDIYLNDTKVTPGQQLTVKFAVTVDAKEELKDKSFRIIPKVNNKPVRMPQVKFHYKVKKAEKKITQPTKTSKATKSTTKISRSPSKTSSSKVPNTTPQNPEAGDIRIKLSYSGTPMISADSYEIHSGGKLITKGSSGTEVSYSNGIYTIRTASKLYTSKKPVRFIPKKGSILKIANYYNPPAWNPNLNDNEYRGILEVRFEDNELIVINELNLEDYLKGLGEVSNSEEPEKIKAIIIAARTYAKFYMEVDEKFPGASYNLDDDPNHSQKYIGYGFEKRAPNIAKAVNETSGELVYYQGKLVKTPYFNQSDGTSTRSAKAVWNWDTDFLVPVDDSYCNGDEFRGHGVGLSGCGAHGMAKQGFTYKEILKHYYTGIEIKDLY